MKRSALIALLLVFLAGVSAGGFWIGKKLYYQTDKQTSSDSTSTQNKKKDRRKEGIYAAGYPQIGPLEQVTLVPLYRSEDGRATLRVPLLVADRLSTGAQVALFDSDGAVFPEGAVIKAITFIKEDRSQASITLALPEAAKDMPFDKAGLILFKNANAKRLPLFAAQRYAEDGGKNGETAFVWVLVPFAETSGQGTVVKRPIQPGLAGLHFFDAGIMLRTADLVVLNPDAALHEGMTISYTIEDFDAPLYGIIEQAKAEQIDRERAKELATRKMPQAMCCMPPPARPADPVQQK